MAPLLLQVTGPSFPCASQLRLIGFELSTWQGRLSNVICKPKTMETICLTRLPHPSPFPAVAFPARDARRAQAAPSEAAGRGCPHTRRAPIVSKFGIWTAFSTSNGKRCGPTRRQCACNLNMASMDRASASLTQPSNIRAASASWLRSRMPFQEPN